MDDYKPSRPSPQHHGTGSQLALGLKIALSAAILGVLIKAGILLMHSRTDGIPLAIKWEGVWLKKNTRDVGQSINQCLGRSFMTQGALQRSNVWFSGWSCAEVGSPDEIYSLNFNSSRNERYFCRAQDRNIIGQHFGQMVLHDLEFIESWDNPDMRQTACQYIRASFQSLAESKKVLIHCDAGRDRTGTYAALVTALTAETTGQLDDAMLDAIECDYQKTSSLTPDKYGRMRRFIESLRKDGGVRQFLMKKCDLNPLELDAVVQKMRFQAS